ncbi:hydroxyethylthiazole kinase [Sulfurospirillum sp. 1612]|uniref:hydroxyethylthiazole kinase n=1 Tax=Sulfurospirillum sp. 1612 TaxID=3094835 RepID=UPI002F93770F
MDIRTEINQALEKIKREKPLIYHITNYVTVNDCANVVLAIGASPVMADEVQEVAEMVSFCGALVLNIGTSNTRVLESMIVAGRAANAKNIPVILDPVGIGATAFRFKSVEKLMQNVKFSVIRGNMAEIKTIAGLEAKSAGVDSLEDEKESPKIAQALAKHLGCVVAITGQIDSISDGERTYLLSNGHSNLSKVTGTGCMSSSLIGSFLGAKNTPLISAIGGIWSMSMAGEMAVTQLDDIHKMGSFRILLMDEIGQLRGETFDKRGKIEQYK